ncbi:MAG: M28 family peptidase [Bacteroidota bacterium]
MKKLTSLIFLFLFAACQRENTTADKFMNRCAQLSGDEMQSIVAYLGSDLLEGRAPGTRGDELAVAYLESLFRYEGFKPGNNGAYRQPFPITGFRVKDITMEANGSPLSYPDDYTGTFSTTDAGIDFEAEAVFVGFGIETEIWDWDDYKDTDLTNKLVITRVNDPGMLDSTIFEGKTLTYFGRWTYHVEEAARRGAAGILLIHTDESAGYNWDVVKNSWSGEEVFIGSDLQNNLKFRGWIRESSLEKILKENGLSIEDLYRGTDKRDFQPRETGIRFRIRGENLSTEKNICNVVAEIPGKVKERIVLSAHFDHLGTGTPINGDSIFNGAIDNGTAVAAMLLTAKILQEFREELYYSVTILACNAEESGLLGSRYYVQNTDRSNIIADINFESTPVWGETGSIMGIGARFSGFEDMLKDLAERNGKAYSEFSLSNQGLFYRSDQFSFARYGIPAVWISAGEDELSGDRSYTEFWGKDYHTVKDEFDPGWEMEGMRQTIGYALLLIGELNRSQKAPDWKDKLPFPLEQQ